MKQVLQKLKEARLEVYNSDLKKAGRNDYSKFDYYTPEQVERLVDNACSKTNTIILCNLKADEFGLYQTLDFIDLDSEEKITFEMRTKHGSITATNETQQMGGTDTYSERYIKMKVFQIKDNNLDIDSQDNRPITVQKQATAPVKPVAKPAPVDKRKEKIVSLCKSLGIENEDYKMFVFSTIGSVLKEENFDEIIDKLEIKLEERYNNK